MADTDSERDMHLSEQPPGTRSGSGELNDLERAVLDFAGLRWRYAGAKESAVRERFGWSPTRYY